MMHNVFPTDGEAVPRHRIEAAIECLINYLDSIDPDPDLEPYLADLEGETEEGWYQPLHLVDMGGAL